MTKQSLGLGTTANDNTGDTLRVGGDKINDNFDEIYSAFGNGTNLTLNVSNAATNQVLKYNGTNFVPGDLSLLTTALDVNNNNITSSSNNNISLVPNGTGDLRIVAGSITSTFDGDDGTVDFPTKIRYINEYTSLGVAPASATYTGYFFTVDGDDNPYVNINVTAGGVGDTAAKIATEYSSIDFLNDVDTTTVAPANDQVLKWSASSSKWIPQDDQSGLTALNLFQTVTADTGSTTANSGTDTLIIAGGTDIDTAIVGDTVTVNFSGVVPSTLDTLSNVDLSSLVQGDSFYYNGTNWVRSQSPLTWFELGSNGFNHFTFSGAGFPVTQDDPTIYVYRGFTYAFDNSSNGASHPLRIQSTTGLSGNPYTVGQSGNGTSVLYWTVPMDAPTTLYYQCTVHAAMAGTIVVVN